VRRDERYETDATPSRAVVERYRAGIDDDESHASLALVHYRGGRDEFDLGIEYSRSSDALDRKTGADILAQLGWSDRTFLGESVAVLLLLLDDPDDEVVSAAAVALGHREDPSAIPALLRFVAHPNAKVRLAVVHGLMRHSHPDAIRAMIQLSRDADHDVRNWATFGLGSQIEDDTPEIRHALRTNLTDPDHEIRGEAIVGLAERKDPSITDILIREWQSSDTVSALSIDAAEIASDARLLEHLERFRTDLPLDDDPSFKSALEAAIKACRGEAEPATPPYSEPAARSPQG
jgi:HEAT repeat protein